MRRTEALCGAWCWAAALMLVAPARADEPAYRYRAPITVSAAGAFLQLPLPASAYGRTAQIDLQDLLVVDAKNERVPFALLAPRAAEVRSAEHQRDAVLYPLPPKPAANGIWASPIEIAVQGDNIRVKRLGGVTPGKVDVRPGGWLIDRIGSARALTLFGLTMGTFVVLTGVLGWVTSTPESLWIGLLVNTGLELSCFQRPDPKLNESLDWPAFFTFSRPIAADLQTACDCR